MGKSPVHGASARVSQALKDLNISFAIAGALAANIHGYHRTTGDVNILLMAEGLAEFKGRWLGRGWVEVFPGSKAVRDTEHNVKIDILNTGGFPGDGKPKPVAFPDPATVAEISPDGTPVLPLLVLIELKLASGMTAAHRPRDLDDVIQLIRVNALPIEYALQLHPYVQDRFRELWTAAQITDDY